MDARNTSGLIVTTPTDREIVLTRSFAAPRGLVFEAWTTPEHVRQWWGCRDNADDRLRDRSAGRRRLALRR